MSTIAVRGGRLEVTFAYDTGLVTKIKSIPGRQWNRDRRCWSLPATQEAAVEACRVLDLPPRLATPEVARLCGYGGAGEGTRGVDRDWARQVWQVLSATEPYDHQVDGLAELIAKDRWGLFWEMGTGKSAPVAVRIALAHQERDWSKTLIVCPKSALDVWQDELRKHAGIERDVFVLAGLLPQRTKTLEIAIKRPQPIVICNYETCRGSSLGDLLRFGFRCIILDECHRIKDSRSKTGQSVRRIACECQYRYALSGTPSPNGPTDIIGTVLFLSPESLPVQSLTALRVRYEQRKNPHVPQMVTGYQNLGELATIVGEISSAVTKDECLDLPAKTIETRCCDLAGEQARVYREMRTKAVARLSGEGNLTAANVLSESVRLLQIVGGAVPSDDGVMHRFTSPAKMGLLLDVLQDFPCVEQAIVWCAFIEDLHLVAGSLPGTVVLHHGKVSDARRKISLDRFRSGEARFLVATSASLREAVTLTTCATEIYYSRNYNLLDYQQSQDRVHRIGQDRPVTVVNLIARGTVDAKVDKALGDKATMQDLIMSGAGAEGLL